MPYDWAGKLTAEKPHLQADCLVLGSAPIPYTHQPISTALLPLSMFALIITMR